MIEQNIESALDSRNEALPTLRELGPPDLVYLVKQSTKSGARQVSRSLRSPLKAECLADEYGM